MNILANVTSSLMGDYNEILDYLVRRINGDKYFNTTLLSDLDESELNLADYDMFVSFMDDDDDILDKYFMLYDYAVNNGKINDFIVYYKSKPYYTSEKLYYSKKDANHDRKHRFMEYEETDEVVYDLMVHASIYHNADINVHEGMLRLMNYDVLDLGAVRMFANNIVINKLYSKIITAREEQQLLISKASLDDYNSLLGLEKIHGYLAGTYVDLDRYLGYSVALYTEIVKAFHNTEIGTLDYIFLKEYYDIGHLTSIASCFHGDYTFNSVDNSNDKLDELLSILKMTVFSMTFADNNKFVLEILENIFAKGKSIELEAKHDDFFFYHTYEYHKRINLVYNIDDMKNYVNLIESKVLNANVDNALSAYNILANDAYVNGHMESSINYALKALEIARKDIDKVFICQDLFEKYKIIGESKKASYYVEKASQYVGLLDTGYFNDYAKVMIGMINSTEQSHILDTWKSPAIDRALAHKYLDRESFYFLSLKKWFDCSIDADIETRIEKLKTVIDDMVENFYIHPVSMLLSIYNALIVLGKLYESIDDIVSANLCYENAMKYVSSIEALKDNNLDADIAFVQFKLGNTAINMDNNQSYKHLAQADRRAYQNILKTGKYIDFYRDIIIAVNMRYFEDNRKMVGAMVARNNLAKLITCAELNDQYYADATKYCSAMEETFKSLNMSKYETEFKELAMTYAELCRDKGIEITADSGDMK